MLLKYGGLAFFLHHKLCSSGEFSLVDRAVDELPASERNSGTAWLW